MTIVEREDKLADAKRQGQAQYESIAEMVSAMRAAELDSRENQDAYEDVDAAREAIQEDALSVQVRSDWHDPGSKTESVEYEILLCTGGPAVRLIGDLGEYNEPETVRMEVQDWFQPWTEYRPTGADVTETLLAYALCFYYGE